MFSHIIVGAGFAGSVIAERIANVRGERVLIVEKRNHIGGNAFDEYDEHGLLIHKYGPHIFHTNQKKVWDYLSRFTEWYHYQHRVEGEVDGRLVSIPFNFESLRRLFPPSLAQNLEQKLTSQFGCHIKVPISKLRQTQDEELKYLAQYIYEKIFLNYTTKQWGVPPEELNTSVTDRVPVYISYDNRYFQDQYQGLPLKGYTKVFEKMLAHPNIHILLNTDYKDVMEIDTQNRKIKLLGNDFNGKFFYTGKIDELYGHRFGDLPYRSLKFVHRNQDQEWLQKTGTVNYPNDHDFTRITEFKHMTGQKHDRTSYVIEYPQEYNKDAPGKDIPYYPIPQEKNIKLYQKYKNLAKPFKNLVLVGRLAEYHYYDMHQIVARALKVFQDEFGKT